MTASSHFGFNVNSFRPPWITLSVVALLAVLAGWLRGSIAGSEGLWLDELHTGWCVSDSGSLVVTRAADGNQTPFFFWLTWMVANVFGHSEFSLRAVSWLASTVTVLIASAVTWRWTGCSVASILVACLVGIGSTFIYYGSEARPYALIQCLGVIQVGLFYEVLWRSPPATERRLSSIGPPRIGLDALLVLVTCLLVYTHITSVWLMVAETLFLIGVGLANRGSRAGLGGAQFRLSIPRRLLFDVVLVGVGCLPLVLSLMFVFKRRGNWEGLSSVSAVWFSVVPGIVSCLAIPAAGFAISIAYHRWFSENQTRIDYSRLIFVGLWALIPSLCLVAMEYLSIAPMALPRYALVGAVAFPIFAGICVSGLSALSARIGLAAVVLVSFAYQDPMIMQFVNEQQIPRMRIEDWRTPVEIINETKRKSAHPVFVFSNLIEDRDALTNQEERFQEYLRFPVSGLYRIDREGREIQAGPTLEIVHFADQHIQQVARQGGAWVLVRGHGDQVSEIGNELRERLAVELERSPEEVQVSVFSQQPSPVYLLSIDW